MKKLFPIEDLLSWRASQAELDAPPPPRAGKLLELTQPWWQVRPEQFRALVQQFETMLRVGYAMDPGQSHRESHPVPAVLAQTNVETTALADILYFTVRGNMLRMRFALRPTPERRPQKMEVTFIAADKPDPMFCSLATFGADGDYRLEAELPPNLALDWVRLRVTERMPFRFILRPRDEAHTSS